MSSSWKLFDKEIQQTKIESEFLKINNSGKQKLQYKDRQWAANSFNYKCKTKPW